MNSAGKILITGAGGFVGTHLVDHLVKAGYSLKFISRKKHPAGETILFDEFMSDKFDTHFFDDVSVVVHLAAVAHSFNLPAEEEIDKIGISYTEKILKAVKPEVLQKVIYLSSIAVSLLDKNIILDTYQYGISKKRSEELLMNFNDSNNNRYQVTVLRPPLVYGKNAPGNFLKLLNLIKKPVVLPFGSFTNKRSFLFIDNLVSAIDTVIKANVPGGFRVYEISDPWLCTLSSFMKDFKKASHAKAILMPFPMSLLGLILTALGKKSLYQKLALELIVDSEKFKRDYQWKPLVDSQTKAFEKSF